MAITFNANRIDIIGSWTNISPVTVTFWFNLNTVHADSNRLMGSDDDWEIRVTTDWSAGSPRISNELFGSTLGTPPISTTVIVAGTWYFVACTATSGGGSALIYINGVLETTGVTTDTATGTTLSIGNRSGSSSTQSADGVIDDMRVYDRILSANEILTIYSSFGDDQIYYGCQNRWLLNELNDGATASGVGTIKDMTGATTGTPVSSPVYSSSRLKYSR